MQTLGVLGSITFVLGAIVTIIGLILLFFRKTRRTGKRLVYIFLTMCLIGFGVAKLSISKNDKAISNVSTLTDTVSTTPSDSTSSSDSSSSVPDTPINKEQYNKIKIGMTLTQVKKLVDEPQDTINSDGQLTWNYQNENSSSGDITFDAKKNIVIEKSEIGILSDNSETKTDKNGTVDDRVQASNEDYVSFIQSAIEDAVGQTVDWNGKSKDMVKQVDVNDNLGKNDGSKLILLHLNAPITATNNAIKQKVNQETLKITKQIKNDSSIDFKIDSITFFWYLPLTDKAGNTSDTEAFKISISKDNLKQINFNHIDQVDLPSVANQYKMLFK